MYVWEAVDFMFCLAPKYHGYSILAQSYVLCPHLAELDIIDFTLYLNYIIQTRIPEKYLRQLSRMQTVFQLKL